MIVVNISFSNPKSKKAVEYLDEGDITNAYKQIRGRINKEKMLRFALQDKEYGIEYIDKLFYDQLKSSYYQDLIRYSKTIDENLAKHGIKLSKIENPSYSAARNNINEALYHKEPLFHGSNFASVDPTVKESIAKNGFSQFSPGSYTSNSLFTTHDVNLAETFMGDSTGLFEFRLRKEVPFLSRNTVCEGIPLNAQDGDFFNDLLYEKGIGALVNPGIFSEIQIFDPKALTMVL